MPKANLTAMPNQRFMPREVSLTPLNARRLSKGLPTVLKPQALRGTGVKLMVCPMKHRRMARAMGKDKGYKLALSKEEMDEFTEGGKIDFKKAVRSAMKMAARQALSPLGPVAQILPINSAIDKMTTGKGKTTRKAPVKAKPVSKGLPRSLALSGLDAEEGGKVDFKKVGRQIKRGYAKIKPVASPIIKELIKKGVTAGITGAVAAIPGAQGFAPVAAVAGNKIGDVVANQLQQKIGFGKKKAMLQSNYSNFLNSHHPGMDPALPQKDNSIAVMEKGGSFAAVGARSSLRGGAMKGSPMSPLLPKGDFSKIRRAGKGFRSV